MNNAFKYIPTIIIIKDFNMHKIVLHKNDRKKVIIKII